MNMNCIFCPDADRLEERVPRHASPWIPIVLIAVVLGAAILASVLTPPSHDFAMRKPVVFRGQLL